MTANPKLERLAPQRRAVLLSAYARPFEPRKNKLCAPRHIDAPGSEAFGSAISLLKAGSLPAPSSATEEHKQEKPPAYPALSQQVIAVERDAMKYPDPLESARRNLLERIERMTNLSPWQAKRLLRAREWLDKGEYRKGEDHMAATERPDLYDPDYKKETEI